MRTFKSLSDNPDMAEVFRRVNDGLMPLSHLEITIPQIGHDPARAERTWGFMPHLR